MPSSFAFPLSAEWRGAIVTWLRKYLVSSPAIRELPAKRIEFGTHPDLNVPIEIRFDRNGVRNHLEPSTQEGRRLARLRRESGEATTAPEPTDRVWSTIAIGRNEPSDTAKASARLPSRAKSGRHI